MGWFKDVETVVTEIVPPTLDEQLAGVARDAERALSVFQKAATSLEIAAEAADAIAAESQRLSEQHAARAEAADEAAFLARARAEKIRSLLN